VSFGRCDQRPTAELFGLQFAGADLGVQLRSADAERIGEFVDGPGEAVARKTVRLSGLRFGIFGR
jgi:hypothetical protein